jgi:hypothetical protein
MQFKQNFSEKVFEVINASEIFTKLTFAALAEYCQYWQIVINME